MSLDMQVFHRHVGHQDTMFKVEFGLLASSEFQDFLDGRSVFWVSSLHNQFTRNLSCRIKFVYPKGLLGPIDLSARNVPACSARVAQFLRFRQIRFTPLQFLFPALAFSDVTADRGQSEAASSSFVRDEENVLPHGYGCTGLEMSKERLTLPATVLEDRWQNLPIESLQIALRYVVGDLASAYLFVPR